jgi:hypothetical protein
MCCPNYAWRLLDLEAHHGFHRTDDHLQKSGHIPMMLKMQTHAMKYNLIFGGIEQTALDYEEETEAVLKEFIKTELEIPDADQIRVHFLGSFYIFNFLINVCYTFLDFITPFINTRG